jgi:protein involved in temperature-dependent protein secretion
MTERARKLVKVMQLREERTRRALARLLREVARKRAGVQAFEQLIDAVQERIDATLHSRYSGGARTVAALSELDAHALTLNASREQLQQLRRQSEQALHDLVGQQRNAARTWRRSDVRLGHATSLTRAERVARMLRACESEDEAHSERHAMPQRDP